MVGRGSTVGFLLSLDSHQSQCSEKFVAFEQLQISDATLPLGGDSFNPLGIKKEIGEAAATNRGGAAALAVLLGSIIVVMVLSESTTQFGVLP